MKMEIWRLTKTARQLRYSEAAEIARFQVAKSGNFQEYADSERKDFRDTFERMLTRREKHIGRHSGRRPMKMEK